jgi:hypothetical protein
VVDSFKPMMYGWQSGPYNKVTFSMISSFSSKSTASKLKLDVSYFYAKNIMSSGLRVAFG